jgi:hypothetical protein
MKLTTSAAILTGFYLALLVWWLTIQYSQTTNTPFNIAFAFAYGLLPIYGGFAGLIHSHHWGFLKSSMGKALFYMSIGLISWGTGEMIWSYYNIIKQIEVPYPSWADAGFLLSWPLWGIGVFHLSRATGIKYALKNSGGKLKLIVIPIIAAIFSYYLLIVVARDGFLYTTDDAFKAFFDLAYPILDIVVISIALVVYGLSLKFLGGRFKWPVVITLLGFVFNYFADFGFSYTTTIGTHYNGNWVDLLFTTAMYTISLGVCSFNTEES